MDRANRIDRVASAGTAERAAQRPTTRVGPDRNRSGGINGIDVLLRTTDDIGPLIARVTLGAVMFPHGAQKLLGWFGGPGFQGEMEFFTATMGIPWILGLLAILAEFLGALGLLTGVLGRVAAFGIASVMVVAVLTSHLQYGFFMDWFGTQRGEGFEYHMLALGLAAIVMVKGSGAWSVDRLLTSR